ncbi:PTS system mannitol-specific transporter subunit IIA [Gallibacterium genomosp. 3]|uniref:PTS system mannitol-specific transporter subunit IIA n=1 Tax=Gallibacterium genomosp. 3 TaxID=505345 RepID=A0A1A7PS32_9PAST|nr:PTS sugar transporter subunit IIA [Gallibacterium genomosp. 3]OBX04854.1 PTS system mannitol-specific transporter subunit IIA [Gallibacterium genomosp. 3]
MLEQFLPKSRIQIVERINSWQDAVRLCAKPLLDEGIIETRYVDNIFRIYEKVGPYFVIAPRIAMPHARPEEGALATGFSLLVVSSGVNFYSEENDPVSLIIMLSAKDNTEHLSALASVAEILSDDANIERLINAKTIDEIFTFIKNQ